MHRYSWEFLEYEFLGNSVLMYLFSVLIFLIGLLVVRIILPGFIKRIEKLLQMTPADFRDFLLSLVKNVVLPLFYLGIVYLALKILDFPGVLKDIVDYLVLGILVFFGVKVSVAFIGYGFKAYLKKRGADSELLKSFQGILMVIRVVVWSGAIIFFLDNLGLKVSALIAGLGIGGIAVALAAQSIFRDLFSYFFILFDRPFKVSDFIIVDSFMGTIEHIGLKTTRVRSLSGEMLIFPNSNLTDSRLRNYHLMQKRRVEFEFNVEYQTPFEKLQEIPKIIQEVIAGIKDAVLDRAHLAKFGDYGLTYQVAYYVLTADYNKYMDIQQNINLSLIKNFALGDIRLAYTQEIFWAKLNERSKK